MNKIIISSLVIITLAALLINAGCKQQKKEERMVIGFAQSTLQSQYYKFQIETAKEYAEELGIKILFVSCEYDVQKQVSQVQDFIAQGVDAVIINPADSNGLGPAVEACNRAGIPVICLDRKIFGGKLDAGFVSDNFMAGKQAGEFMVQKSNGMQLNILNVQGSFADRNAVERDNGFKEAIKDNPNLRIITEVASDWNQQKAANGVQSALIAHSEINAIFLASDYLAPAVIATLKSQDKLHPRGQAGHILISSVDGDPFGVEMILKGFIDSDSSQGCVQMAKASIDACLKLAKGDKISGELIYIPTVLLTIDNIESLGQKGEQWGWLIYQREKQAK